MIDFVRSHGITFIGLACIIYAILYHTRKPRNRRLFVWEEPRPGQNYVIGADVAEEVK